MAIAQGKRNLILTFSRHGKHKEFCCKGPFTSSDCDTAAISLRNLIYCFGIELLHPVSATSLRCHSQMALQPIWERCRRRVAVNGCKWALTRGQFLMHNKNIWWYLLIQRVCFFHHIFKIFSFAFADINLTFRWLSYLPFSPILVMDPYFIRDVGHLKMCLPKYCEKQFTQ